MLRPPANDATAAVKEATDTVPAAKATRPAGETPNDGGTTADGPDGAVKAAQAAAILQMEGDPARDEPVIRADGDQACWFRTG